MMMFLILFAVSLIAAMGCVGYAAREYDYEEGKRTPKCRNYLIVGLVLFALSFLFLFAAWPY